ncbi:serine protease 23-like protein [Corchorus olitorius]|uniref:Serine protease 23-like protein n=1 Tax=Corchorus olitorius TaxID=93759 RepID=A0A1R3GAX0_9ROSI|nr:serine protease 23-like protein [Corchorus olitorius]
MATQKADFAKVYVLTSVHLLSCGCSRSTIGPAKLLFGRERRKHGKRGHQE